MANSDDVLVRVEILLHELIDPDPTWVIYRKGIVSALQDLAAEVRALRERVAELESDHEWIAERCAACGHRFAYPSNACARCNTKVGSTEPDVYPELCECPRCIVARNVAMDAKREGEA